MPSQNQIADDYTPETHYPMIPSDEWLPAKVDTRKCRAEKHKKPSSKSEIRNCLRKS